MHKPSPSRALKDQSPTLAAGDVRTASRPSCSEELTTTYTFLEIAMKISRGLFETIGKLLTCIWENEKPEVAEMLFKKQRKEGSA